VIRTNGVPIVSQRAGRAPGRPKKARVPSGDRTPYPAAEGQERQK